MSLHMLGGGGGRGALSKAPAVSHVFNDPWLKMTVGVLSLKLVQ